MNLFRKSIYFKFIIPSALIITTVSGLILYFFFDIIDLKRLSLILFNFFITIILFQSLFLVLLVLRPIHKLSKTLEIASAGNFLVRSELNTHDELGELSMQFNQMLSKATDLMANDIEREREMITVREELKYKRLLEKRSRQIERINRQLELRVRETTLLYDTISSMASMLELDDLLKKLSQNVGEILGYKEFAILLLDKNSYKLKVVASYGMPEKDIHGMEFALGEGIAGSVAQTGDMVLIPDTSSDPKYLHWKGKKIEKGSFLCIPLKYKERILGVFTFNSPAIDGFSRRDIKLLTALSHQAAISIVNAQLYEETKELSIKDELTLLYNRRWFNYRIEEEFKRALRFENPLSLLMIDIDHFKHYNDSHGHLMGDVALKKVAEVLINNVREVDSVARYGGEEFVIILPKSGSAEARTVAEKICRMMREQSMPHSEKQPSGKFTISIGYSSFPENAKDVESLIQQSDFALYVAKRKGRDAVVGYGEVETSGKSLVGEKGIKTL